MLPLTLFKQILKVRPWTPPHAHRQSHFVWQTCELWSVYSRVKTGPVVSTSTGHMKAIEMVHAGLWASVTFGSVSPADSGCYRPKVPRSREYLRCLCVGAIRRCCFIFKRLFWCASTNKVWAEAVVASISLEQIKVGSLLARSPLPLECGDSRQWVERREKGSLAEPEWG